MKAYSYNFATKTLTITKDFAEKANNPTSDEHKIIKAFQEDFPSTRIAIRTHKTPSKYHTKEGETLNRNKFKGLTYERMEHFIDALPKAEEYRKQYDFIKENAINPYHLTSKWFMAQFPKFRTNPLYYITNTAEIIDACSLLYEEDHPDSTEEKAG